MDREAWHAAIHGVAQSRKRLKRLSSSSTSIESVMPSSHLILCRPLLLLPPISPSIRVRQNLKLCNDEILFLFEKLQKLEFWFYFAIVIVVCQTLWFLQFCSFFLLNHPRMLFKGFFNLLFRTTFLWKPFKEVQALRISNTWALLYSSWTFRECFNILTWKIKWTEEPCGLQSTESQKTE